MAQIYSLYNEKVDRTWYNSSNILYSECDDNENALKTLRITFHNGRTYEYYDVDVNDYVLFKNASSQGQDFNKRIRKYETKRLEDKDTTLISEELKTLLEEQSKKEEQC